MERKSIILAITLMILTSLAFSYEINWTYEKEPYYKPGEIVPTPVPVDIVKRVVLDDGFLASTTGEPLQDMWGQYVDCELYPIYDENNIPVEYLVLAYREKSERIGMWDMIERIKPYFYEWRKIDLERVRFNEEQSNFWLTRGQLLDEWESKRKSDEFVERYAQIEERLQKAYLLMSKNGQYGFGFANGVYELVPRITEFHNGCIPDLFIFYNDAINRIKKEYKTDDVEFVCLRSLGLSGSRGWEFRAGDKRLYVTINLLHEANKPYGQLFIKEITPELKTFWWDDFTPALGHMEMWNKYKEDNSGMLFREDVKSTYSILRNVSDYDKYSFPHLPDGCCAHVPALNILAYQNYRGYKMELEDWAWDWIRGEINCEYRSQWTIYAKDDTYYKNIYNYGCIKINN